MVEKPVFTITQSLVKAAVAAIVAAGAFLEALGVIDIVNGV